MIGPVPEGTQVKTQDGDTVLADLVNPGDRWLAAEGGRGGRGNARFLSNRRRAPAFAEQGEVGEERWLRLELKLMADVALVGFPSVGKSTLIPVISAEIGRTSCRERVCQAVYISVVAESLKKKQK